MDPESQNIILSVIKMACILLNIIFVMGIGSLPITLKKFKPNKKLLAFTSAFTGGLFLAISLILLLPRSQVYFAKFWVDDQVHFPWTYLIAIGTFSLILVIQKILIDFQDQKEDKLNQSLDGDSKLLVEQKILYTDQPDNITNAVEQQEEFYKMKLSVKMKLAKKIGFVQTVQQSVIRNPSQSVIFKDVNLWGPYIIQIALGVHQILEGLAIGVSQQISFCENKKSDALTLGYIFRQVRVRRKKAQYFILFQSFMTPIGIGIGWALSDISFLTTGMLYALSAGTFLYLSTVEILQEEFIISRERIQKYGVCLIAIGIVFGIWFI